MRVRTRHLAVMLAVFAASLPVAAVAPDARFDQWLMGNDEVITPRELAGYTLFKESGCVACHNGPAAGGTSFQRMGVVQAYQSTFPAEGRSAVTGKDADRCNFKVAMLRHGEMTYPYFHDREAATLEKAVDIMGRLQLAVSAQREKSATS